MGNLWEWITDNKGKFIALIIAVLYLIVIFFTIGISICMMFLMWLLLPLSCIFFGEAMGAFVGGRLTRIRRTSPSSFVVFIGWILLLLPLIVVAIVFFSKKVLIQ